METLEDNMKNCVLFINIDIHAHRGGETANPNEEIKETVIYFENFERRFS